MTDSEMDRIRKAAGETWEVMRAEIRDEIRKAAGEIRAEIRDEINRKVLPPPEASVPSDRQKRVNKQMDLLGLAAQDYVTAREAWVTDKCSNDLRDHTLEALCERARLYAAAYAED